MKYKIQYYTNRYYYNYEDDRIYGGGTIRTLSREFDALFIASDYAEEHKWEWDKNPQWNNKEYQIITSN